MNRVLHVLDRGDTPPADWLCAVEASMAREPHLWVEATDSGLSTDDSWRLLAFARTVGSSGPAMSAGSLKAAYFACALLDACPLDRRDVLVVTREIEAAAGARGLDARSACEQATRRAGSHGQRAQDWLCPRCDPAPGASEQPSPQGRAWLVFGGALLAAALFIGVVVLGYAFDLLPLVGVFVAMVLGPVIALGAQIVRDRRAERRSR